MSNEIYEPVTLIVHDLVLQGVQDDATLASDNAVSKSYVDTKVSTAISQLINGSPATLDTLKEIADALGNDANLASVLTAQIAAVNASVASESASRAASDATINAYIATESVASAVAVQGVRDEAKTESAFVRNALSDESKARTASDVALDALFNTEKGVRDAFRVEDKLEVASEVANRESAVNDLNMLLSEESSTRVSADNAMDVKMADETKAREDADALKFDKAGGHVGEVTLDSYLYFSSNWRVFCSNDGSKILFQHKKADGVWRTALPFICAV